jgi:hypothetical protein
MITSPQHVYYRAVNSYSAAARLAAARPLLLPACLPACLLRDPVPPASPTPLQQSVRRCFIDGRIPNGLTSNIQSSCFYPVAHNNLLLLPFRFLPISRSEMLFELCNRHVHRNGCARTQFTSQQQAGWLVPQTHVREVSTSKLCRNAKWFSVVFLSVTSSCDVDIQTQG